MATAASSAQSSITVEDYVFPPSVRPPASDKSFSLAGAGVRGLMIEGNFVTFTCSGIYLDVDAALPSLAPKWKGKSADELARSVEFFRDIVTGPFDKFIQTTMIKPLTGAQFSAKVAENCIAIMKAFGTYTEVEEKAIEKFMEIFKDERILPGFSVYFKQSPIGTLTTAFGKHDVIKGVRGAVIENGPLSQAFLESIIGKNGVSPATKKSMANRVNDLLHAYQVPTGEVENNENCGETKV